MTIDLSLAASALLLMLAIPASSADNPPANLQPLSITIAPTGGRNDTRNLDLSTPQQHFHVVIHNKSEKPVKLWQEWCSWGWHNLTFEIIDADGTTTIAKKKARGWDKNFPSHTTIDANGDAVIDVFFDPELWDLSPKLRPSDAHAPQVLTMRAVYVNAAGTSDGSTSDQSDRWDMWVGTITSDKLPYTLRR